MRSLVGQQRECEPLAAGELRLGAQAGQRLQRRMGQRAVFVAARVARGQDHARREALRRQLARRASPPAADALLCTALALAWDERQAPYEVFTLVNQAVEAAKRDPATRGQAGFINGCLRRFLRERDALVASTDSDPVAQWNHPRWWIEQVRKDHPSQWQAILHANNAAAPMTLRVNARKEAVARYQTALAAMKIIATPVATQGLVLEHACAVTALPGFADGVVSVQDAAAQLAAPLLLGALLGCLLVLGILWDGLLISAGLLCERFWPARGGARVDPPITVKGVRRIRFFTCGPLPIPVLLATALCVLGTSNITLLNMKLLRDTTQWRAATSIKFQRAVRLSAKSRFGGSRIV